MELAKPSTNNNDNGLAKINPIPTNKATHSAHVIVNGTANDHHHHHLERA
jgi:hypothetical protein